MGHASKINVKGFVDHHPDVSDISSTSPRGASGADWFLGADTTFDSDVARQFGESDSDMGNDDMDSPLPLPPPSSPPQRRYPRRQARRDPRPPDMDVGSPQAANTSGGQWP